MTTKFGWCLDGRHLLCHVTSPDGAITCGCQCHDEVQP